jgi:hypothetical protein
MILSCDVKRRSTNFSSKEEDLLLSLVEKYKVQVECKRSDTNNLQMKTLVWQKICTEYNSSSGEVYRDSNVLKKKYGNIKKRTKTKFAAEKANLYKTGGGPPAVINITDADQKVKNIIGTQLTGL